LLAFLLFVVTTSYVSQPDALIFHRNSTTLLRNKIDWEYDRQSSLRIMTASHFKCDGIWVSDIGISIPAGPRELLTRFAVWGLVRIDRVKVFQDRITARQKSIERSDYCWLESGEIGHITWGEQMGLTGSRLFPSGRRLMFKPEYHDDATSW
jgi:hypothetical protein